VTIPAQQQLEVSRQINARPKRVFDAWTRPEMIIQWWGAGGVTCPSAEIDLTVGGTYRIANQTPDGSTMWITGTFSRIEPPNALAYTWAMEPIEPDTIHSLVEVRFELASDGTLVTVRQTRIASPEAREMHLAGWIGCLDGLLDLLSD
jgi:uncharacterized protein YndB with AHSA1/START domain